MKNGGIKNVKREILSDNWYILNKYTYDYQKPDGSWETQEREAYDRGNGAAILLYNSKKRLWFLPGNLECLPMLMVIKTE